MKIKAVSNPSIKLSTTRPAVVVLLGHVDHGKTSLLSALKKQDLTKKEFGGISQHTKAYQVRGPEGEKITFIDTPGHEAFGQMRSRGAKIADLAMLIIAANEGLKPQTRECLKFIKEAKLPFFVVINKIDVAGADSQMVKAQLSKEDVLVEDFGGKIVALEVSAKTGKGLEELLEMILLFAELEGIKVKKGAALEAVVIEATRDAQKGLLATVLLKSGSLHQGDEVFTGEEKTKVRAIFDEDGKRINMLEPGEAGVVLGFKQVLAVGSIISWQKQEEQVTATVLKPATEMAKETQLKIILKADVLGTLEAIEAGLPEKVVVLNRGVGPVTESEVLEAINLKGVIVAFNVAVPRSVKELARIEKVELNSFNIIYELFDWLEKRLEVRAAKEAVVKIKGEAQIIAVFKVGALKVAGMKILKGEFSTGDSVTLKRKEQNLGQTKIGSIKHEKEAVKKAVAGKEYGLILESQLDFKIGDVILSYSENN